MRIYTQLEGIPSFTRAVVTIGTFDGVHKGHQQIIAQLRAEALAIGGETVIITFHPHPRRVVHSAKPPLALINTIEERIELLRQNGVDHLVIIPFTEAFSHLSAEAYVEDFLVARFHPHTVIIGYDHRFGQGRKGDYKLLEKYSGSGAFSLKEIPEQLLNNSIVSSTRIRDAVSSGDIAEANALLGYPFFFTGTVVNGNRLGRELGYPTANLEIGDHEKLVPGNGIYAVQVILGEKDGSIDAYCKQRLNGMMSIGVRPTIGGGNRVIEVNIFDFNDDIYQRRLRVYVCAYLRPEEKFATLDDLKKQMALDKIRALEVLNG